LYFASNRISVLPPGAFDHLTGLRWLFLTANQISALPAGIFVHTTALVQLDLTSNSISFLPAGVFDTLSDITWLFLGTNRLSSLPADLFYHTSNLVELGLSSNQITSLPASLFSTLFSLDKLYLVSNRISVLPAGLFDHLPKLTLLHISDNNLTAIPAGIFANLNPANLDLSSNQISTIAAGVFDSFTILSMLDLRLNQIATLPSGLFDRSRLLTMLRLSFNQLSAVSPGLFDNLSALAYLGLDSNQLGTLPAGLFDSLTRVKYLSLSSNRISTLPAGLFDHLNKAKLLHLEANQIHSLPAGLFDHLSNLTFLDVSSNQLGALPAALLEPLSGLVQLDLASNQLTALPDLSEFSSLTFLNISDNHIVEFPRLPLLLSFLNVSNNRELLIPGSLLRNYTLSTLDISGTMISTSDFACGWVNASHRMNLLQATDIRAIGEADEFVAKALTSCLPRVKLLDISDNGVVNLTLVDTTLASTAYILSVSPDDLNGKSDMSQLQLGRDSQVLCDLERKDSQRFYLDGWQSLPTLAYACSCSPAFEPGPDGICRPRPPFWTSSKVAGLAVGMMLLSFLVMGAILLALRRHRTVRANLDLHRLLLEDTQDEVDALKRAWEVLPSELVLEARVDGDSPGAFGEVWRAKWEDLTVAVKTLQQGVMDMDAEALEEFHKEVEFMQKTRHPNIVRFFGAGTWPDGRPFFVVELVTKGSLKSFLRGRGSEARAIPWAMKASFALDVARGMAYIHSLGQMHRDLKSGNALITEQDRAKIADFGTIRQLLVGRSKKGAHGSEVRSMAAPAGPPAGAPSSLELTAGKGTPLYMSPEVIRGGDYNQQADVWSFGVLLWEIAAQRAPDLLEQEGVSRGPLLGRLLNLLDAGKRLHIDAGWPEWWSALAVQCWACTAGDRPKFEEVVRVVERGVGAGEV
jgi:LRR receptor-like serine/threonine-protein kinase FLS2